MANALNAPDMLTLAMGYGGMLFVPGPSLLIVLQAGLSPRRHNGLVTALGVAFGASMLVFLLAWSSLHVPPSGHWAMAGRLICIAVLLVAAYRALRSGMRAQEARQAPTLPNLTPFLMGFVTALSNPLSLAFFSSAVLSIAAGPAQSGMAILPLAVFIMAFGWYGMVGILVAQPRISAVYRSLFRLISIGSGIALLLVAGSMALPVGQG